MANTQTEIFFEKLQSYIDNKELIKLSLTGKRDKLSDLKKLIITAVELKKGYCLNVVYRHNTRDITKNFEIAEGIELVAKALENDFVNAELLSISTQLNLMVLPNGKVKLKTTENSACPTHAGARQHKRASDQHTRKYLSTRVGHYERRLGSSTRNE